MAELMSGMQERTRAAGLPTDEINEAGVNCHGFLPGPLSASMEWGIEGFYRDYLEMVQPTYLTGLVYRRCDPDKDGLFDDLKPALTERTLNAQMAA